MSNTLLQKEYNQGEFEAEPRTLNPKSKYREDQQFYSNEKFGSKVLRNKSQTSEFSDNDGFENQYQELDGKVTNASDIQEDYYVDRAPKPLYKPVPKGLDAETQIQDWELFDFQIEVEPILQTIVGKVIQQSRMELIEQDEITELNQHKIQYSKLRNAELMVTQRMEGNRIRREQEIDRRNLQHDLNNQQKKLTHKKLLSKLLTKSAFKSLKPNTLNDLEQQRFLKNDMNEILQETYVPWLLDEVSNSLLNFLETRNLQNELILGSQNNVLNMHVHNRDVEVARRNKNESIRQRRIDEKNDVSRRKKAHKQAKAQSQIKSQKLNALLRDVIQKGQLVENILESNVLELLEDGGNKQSVGLIGGNFGEFLFFLQQIQEFLNDQEKNPQENQQHYNFLNDEEATHKVVVFFINNGQQNGFHITINQKYKQKIENLMELSQSDYEQYKQQLDVTIADLISNNDLLVLTPSFNLIKDQLDHKLIQKLLKSFLHIYCLVLPPPTQEKIETEEGEEQIFKEIKYEPSKLENQIVQAKDRLKFSYALQQEYSYKSYDAVLIYRVKLDRDSPKPQVFENQFQDNDNVSVDSYVPEHVYIESFVEPYDGSSFEKIASQFNEMPVTSTQSFKTSGKQVLVFDKRAPRLLRNVFCNLLKKFFDGSNDEEYSLTLKPTLMTDNEEIVLKINQKSSVYENIILNSLIKDKDQTPLYDIE